jgi:hypothetical protein
VVGAELQLELLMLVPGVCGGNLSGGRRSQLGVAAVRRKWSYEQICCPHYNHMFE